MQRHFAALFLFSVIVLFLLPTQEVLGLEGGRDDPCGTFSAGLKAAECLAKKTSERAGFETTEARTSLPKILGTLVQAILSLLGILFLFLMISGGYQWMTAGGTEEKVTKAKSTMTNAAIGLGVVLAAYALYAFVGGMVGLF